MPYISVVTPVYNAVNIVEELHHRLVEHLEAITDDFEIIMVNDACPYGSGEKIAEIAAKDPRVKFMELARNFGQHRAISAGLDYAEGEYVVVMDCDLQDPPHKIALLLEELQRSGKEAIFAIREHRKDCFLKKAESHVFNTVMRKLTNRIYHGEKGTGNFSIITHRVVLAYRKLREHHRCYGSIIQYCGFELAYLPIEGDERFEGSSSYTFLKSIRLAFSILLQQSARPLFISALFSVCSFLASFLFAGMILYNKISGEYDVNGYAGIMFTITLMGGMIFLTLAVMSLYLANIFEEVKGRPLYVIGKTVNFEEKSVS